VPWDEAGRFLRFSVTFAAETARDEREVIREMEKRMGGLELRF
jgi:LL-diaminopimelate aminotransferase